MLRLLFLPFLHLPALFLAQTHTFDANNQGWGASGDPTSQTAAWIAAGGNPGGHIRVTDNSVGGTWYFDAPDDFTGNKCDTYGKYLRYDQRTSDTSNQQQYGGRPDVLIFGAGLILAFDNAYNPGLDWTHYDILLAAGAGWRLDDIDGPVATEAQIRAVLSDMSGLRIRGEYRSQDDFGTLDNVVLESGFTFDLDADDSSVAQHGNFLNDTLCASPSQVADTDLVLTSESPVDSIRITILFPTPTDAFALDIAVPGIAVTYLSDAQLTLINTGGATVGDFTDLIQNLYYLDNAPEPAPGTRLVEFRVFTECGLAAVRTSWLPIYPPPYAGADTDTTLCAGTAPLSLAAALDNPAPGGSWQPATVVPGVFDPARDTPGVFHYIVRGAGECPADTAWVSIAVQPGFQLRADTTLCYGDTLALPVPPGLIAWTWSDGSRGETLDVVAPGAYALEGRSGECVFADSVSIGFYSCKPCPFYAPNVFSPNDDGDNEVFQVFLGCIWSDFRLEIFDRWGGLVFAGDDPAQGWDGTVRGRPAAPGVYFWRAEWREELFGEVKTVRKMGDVGVVR